MNPSVGLVLQYCGGGSVIQPTPPSAITLLLCLATYQNQRGTSALHLNEPTWIINGFNELIVDFLFALVLFLDSKQPRPLKYPK